MPIQERYTVRFVCDVRAAPECARLVQRFSDTTGAPGRLPDRRTAIRFALLLARDRGWRVTPARRPDGQAVEVYAVCPLCLALRPDAGPPELHLVPDIDDPADEAPR